MVKANDYVRVASQTLNGGIGVLKRMSKLAQSAASRLGERRGVELPRGANLVETALKFNLQVFSSLSNHALAFLDEVASSAERALNANANVAQAASPASPSKAQIVLSGMPGERATASFIVENTHTGPLDVVLHSSDLTPDQGDALPARLLVFEPARLTLKAGEQSMVRAVVDLGPEFRVGRTYKSTIRIEPFQSQEIELRLFILAPAASAVTKSTSTRKNTTGRSRGRKSSAIEKK